MQLKGVEPGFTISRPQLTDTLNILLALADCERLVQINPLLGAHRGRHSSTRCGTGNPKGGSESPRGGWRQTGHADSTGQSINSRVQAHDFTPRRNTGHAIPRHCSYVQDEGSVI